MMKILCLCDSPTLTSGFARVATNLMMRWHDQYGAEVHCWGITFSGWAYTQHPYVKVFFPAGSGSGSDHWTTPARMELFLRQLSLDGYTHVWILQDTFLLVNENFPQRLRKVCTEKKIKSMYYFPVDAPLDESWTDIIAAVDVPVAFTEYGRREAMAKLQVRKVEIWNWNAVKPEKERFDLTGMNYDVEVKALPHGVDTKMYRAMDEDRMEARAKAYKAKDEMPAFLDADTFLMVNVNVNQRRKDTTRSLELLKAVRALGVPAKLVMHMGSLSDGGQDLELAGKQLGLKQNEEWTHHNHLFVRGQATMSQEQLVHLYNIADLYTTTTLGEGWGLGITEALACGTAVAVPNHTSCAEIADYVSGHGMRDSVVVLPVEQHGLMQDLDNTRLRKRVDVNAAALAIKAYYDSGVWRNRPGLSGAVKDWLDWNRIAKAMLGLYRESGKRESGKAETVQTPALNADSGVQSAEPEEKVVEL